MTSRLPIHPRTAQRALGGLALLAALVLFGACSDDGQASAPRTGKASSGGSAGAAGSPQATGGESGGSAGEPAEPTGGVAGAGLTSSVFGSEGDIAPPAETTVECPAGEAGVCDWSRATGCCAPLACDKAPGNDVYDVQPQLACEALMACVQKAGCTSASDPLCFTEGSCKNEGYQASHESPTGPFAHTLKLIACVCSYPPTPN